MSIDFFTFCAQILNLLILLFLLRKFLYLPVLKVLDERKSIMENEYKAAENARRQAEKTAQKIQKEYATVESEKQKILAQSHIKAEELAQKLTAEAQSEFEKARKSWKNKLTSEQNTFDLALQNLIVTYFEKFTDNALNQMADITLNELFLHKLEQKISSLSKKQKRQFSDDFLQTNELSVITAKEISAESKRNFKNFLQDEFLLPENIKIKFATDEKLICGITIKAGEQMIAWNLADYIAEFSKNLNTAVSSLINKD